MGFFNGEISLPLKPIDSNGRKPQAFYNILTAKKWSLVAFNTWSLTAGMLDWNLESTGNLMHKVIN